MLHYRLLKNKLGLHSILLVNMFLYVVPATVEETGCGTARNTLGRSQRYASRICAGYSVTTLSDGNTEY
uniref:Secreted protein n=1 Tax=Anguilla anguilla TaxID=7936 RepID=A0A0E9PIB8_ANGAN